MDAPAPTPSLASRARALASRAWFVVERLAVGHFLGYPISFIWAVAAIPLTIHLSIGALDALDGDTDKIGQLIVRRLVWPAGTAFVLAHLAAIPWVVSKDSKAGLRRTFLALGGLAAVGIVFAAGSWLWLLLR